MIHIILKITGEGGHMQEILFTKAFYLQQAELEQLRMAMRFAEQAHAGQYRISGEPYIIHPFAVTEILLDYQADITTLIAALLHDVVEDTHYTTEDITQQFGTKIAMIVEGLTKVDKKDVTGQDEYKAINLKKLLLAAQMDIRVAIIKVVDRLHNMRTLQVKTAQKQVPYASETLKIFSPLCKKLKLSYIRRELEELSFFYLKPSKYDKTKHCLKQYEQLLERLSQTLQISLASTIPFTISYEMKPMYSAYSKIKDNEEFAAIAKMIITTSNALDCYQLFGDIHQMYQPISHRFEDHMTNRTFNHYLKTTIMLDHLQLDIIIETTENRLRREQGVFYFLTDATREHQAHQLMDTFILTNHQLTQNAIEFYDFITFELLQETITAFTPTLDTVYLPQDATIIDFAFTLNPALAKRMFGAKINGVEKPLTTKVAHLDIVELLVANQENQNLNEWLNFANSSKAQFAINQELA